MVREFQAPYVVKRITTVQDAVGVFRDVLRDEDRERLVAMCLDSKNRPNAIYTIAIGDLSQVPTHPREVFKAAILANAASIILAHNHPSGDPNPSRDDIMITKRLAAAGRIIGIEVLDHVVIGDNEYVSLKQSGMMKYAEGQVKFDDVWVLP